MKTCRGCSKELPLTLFYRGSICGDGLFQKCAKCRADSKELSKQNRKEWYRKSQSKVVAEKRRQMSPEKKAAISKRSSEYTKARKAKDPMYKLLVTLRSRNYLIFKGQSRESAKYLLGCSVKKAMAHIESKFEQGMSWNNHGAWELDHIVPLATAKSLRELKKLCHFKNLQPLWVHDHKIKTAGDLKIIKDLKLIKTSSYVNKN